MKTCPLIINFPDRTVHWASDVEDTVSDPEVLINVTGSLITSIRDDRDRMPGLPSTSVSTQDDPRSRSQGRRSSSQVQSDRQSPGKTAQQQGNGDKEGRRSKSVRTMEHNKEKEGDGIELSPLQLRPKPNENYEKPKTGRESWWRSTIRETPVPGRYEYEDFTADLGKRHNSYRFKSEGRKSNPQPQIGRGVYLLPGAYEYEDFEKRVSHFKETYGFKNTSRDHRDMMLFGKKDKDVNVSPNAYSVETHMSLDGNKCPSKHWNFRSGTTRFPTKQFKPKEGPPPGGYDYSPPASLHTVSSSFQSKTPRFSTSHTKVPGPGSYARMYRPMTETVTKMGRNHGIFFTPHFECY